MGELPHYWECLNVPRMVGRALKQIPDDLSAPCHRVVNASGRLVPGWTEQKQLLLEEGISFKQNGCVDLKKHLWNYSVPEMKFAYLIYFPYLCANNMQEQTVIYL